MTEDEYRRRIAWEREKARDELRTILYAAHRRYWPDGKTDPIYRENRRRRFQRELAVQAYWGVPQPRLMFGGICGA